MSENRTMLRGPLTADWGTREKFWRAAPYPHVALDDFFDARFFASLSASMQAIADQAPASHNYNSDIERNKQCFSENDFDANLSAAARYLSGPEFLAFLETLLEVKGLIPLTAVKRLTGRTYFHVSSGGGFLGSHVDQSYVGRRLLPKYIHVASCVFYGSPQWQPEYGGHTILFDKSGQNAVTTVECRPNRTNVFLHTSTSFHGVSEMTTDKKRYSLYMDYYLPQRLLGRLQESIVRNHARCEPNYWLHNVIFVPNSSDPVYQRGYERYLAAAAKPL
jgi:Rps23 Pro-64 3,4-dihydroxylase Tpa1-like proline 4-hydroxylase